MDRNTLRKIFDFIEEKESKSSLAYKILNDFDNIRDNELIVNGNLNLENKNITSLPEGLQVEGDLYLTGCTNLTSLPDGLQVGGNLYLANTPLAKYTDGELLKMIGFTGYIKGIIKRYWRG